jgi:hypothetical protein
VNERGHFEYLKTSERNRSAENVKESKSFLFTEIAGLHVVTASIVVARNVKTCSPGEAYQGSREYAAFLIRISTYLVSMYCNNSSSSKRTKCFKT